SGLDGTTSEDAAMLVRAVRSPAGTKAVQFAPRSVRAGRRELKYLLGLGDLSRLYCLSNAGHCRCANRELQKISTAPKAGLVQLGRRDENAGGRRRRGKPLTAPEHL